MTEPQPQTITTRLIARVEPWFRAAVERHHGDDEVTWDVFVQAFPSPQNEGFVTVVGLSLEMPGVLLGTTISSATVLQPSSITADSADELVRNLMEQLRQGRTDQIAQMQQMQEQAARNGSTPPRGGLILPGQ